MFKMSCFLLSMLCRNLFCVNLKLILKSQFHRMCFFHFHLKASRLDLDAADCHFVQLLLTSLNSARPT